jgi:hypothetical protein
LNEEWNILDLDRYHICHHEDYSDAMIVVHHSHDRLSKSNPYSQTERNSTGTTYGDIRQESPHIVRFFADEIIHEFHIRFFRTKPAKDERSFEARVAESVPTWRSWLVFAMSLQLRLAFWTISHWDILASEENDP